MGFLQESPLSKAFKVFLSGLLMLVFITPLSAKAASETVDVWNGRAIIPERIEDKKRPAASVLRVFIIYITKGGCVYYKFVSKRDVNLISSL